MQGTVLTFQHETNTGLISGHDGVRYNFTMMDWQSKDKPPREGQLIDFEPEDKSARHIIVMKRPRTGNHKSRMTALLLALLLGGLGAHKFYLGQPVWGIVYILFCWTFVPAIVAFIEFLVYAFSSDDAFDAKYNNA